MIHLVFTRHEQSLKVFDANGTEAYHFRASGDAWGDGEHAPYGHDYPISPGHYKLTTIEPIEPPSNAEGAYQIYVEDFTPADITRLITAGKAEDKTADGSPHMLLTIGGIVQACSQLAVFGRSEIMLHGGGSNAPEPLAPIQVLCKTYGCTRLHNADLSTLVAFLRTRISENTVAFTVIGDPLPVPN